MWLRQFQSEEFLSRQPDIVVSIVVSSISSLFGFLVVALALIWRRYHGAEGAAKGADPRLPAAHLIWLLGSSAGDARSLCPLLLLPWLS